MSKRWLWVAFVVMAPTVACLVGLGQVGANSGNAHMDYGPTATTPWSLPNQSVASSSLLTATVYLPLTCKNFQPPIVLRVGGSGQYTIVQDAINAAAPPYEYIVQVAQGTYQENITVVGPKTITLQGGWNSQFTSRSSDCSLTVIDGGRTHRVIGATAGPGARTDLYVDGFTITNGQGALPGGGIYAEARGPGSRVSLTLNNNTITKNQVTPRYQGGGINIYATEQGSSMELLMTNSAVVDNTADNGGGGVCMTADGGSLVATLMNNSIERNVTNNEGGGVWVYAGNGGSVVATLSQNVITGNIVTPPTGVVPSDGGGIVAHAREVSTNTILLQNNLIKENEATWGGGIFGYAFHQGSELNITLLNNIISYNEALDAGGGLFSCSGRTSPDSAPGGSVFWTLTNNTLTQNVARVVGGIHIYSGSTFGDGGDISVNLRNDIVWGNTSEMMSEIACEVEAGQVGTAIVNAEYSDIGSIEQRGGGTYTLTHVINEDPLFVDPSNQGLFLQDGSPAIDAGDPNPVYNDGSRPPGKGTERGDMGAYGGPNNDNWP